MMPSVPKVKSVTVIIEMADGKKRELVSRPDSIKQNEGVMIYEDNKIDNDVMYQSGVMVDMSMRRTVTWVEQWTEMSR